MSKSADSKRKIYVASSWRNEYQQGVVEALRSMGHEVYDFRNPPNGSKGFAWSDIDEKWEDWTTDDYAANLDHPIAIDGFNSDFDGMKWADTCVMVLPCGRSANTEAGWMKGQGKQVFVFSPIKQEPELMYKLYDGIISNVHDLQQTFSAMESYASQPEGREEKEEVKRADITEAEMLADGWIKSKEQPAIILFEKHIPNRNPINDTPEDTDIKLVVHCYYSCWTFAVLLPNGAMLNFVANSMQELQDFENKLTFYDCPY